MNNNGRHTAVSTSHALVPAYFTDAVHSLLNSGFRAVFSPLLVPWHLTMSWVSLVSSMAINFLAYLGAPPKNYVSVAKVAELNSVVEHLMQREDQYRRAVRELQEELDAKNSDKKKALHKLKRTRGEVLELMGSLDSTRRDAYDSSVAPERFTRRWLHVTAACLVAAVWWFWQSDNPAIHRKLVGSLIFPLGWVYLHTLMRKEQRSHPWYTPFLYCSTWFIIGLITAHKLRALDY